MRSGTVPASGSDSTSPVARATSELVLDGGRVEAAGGEGDVGVEPEVGDLLDHALVVFSCHRQGGLDALLAELLGGRGRPVAEEAGDVRAFRHLPGALADAAPEPRRETRERARVARGPLRRDAEQERVAVAVVADLVDEERVAGGLALVPDRLPGAAVEVRLAGLARQPLGLVVHPGQHE